ncbi:mitochondrial transcription termination factor family protein [Actinidia rufa]|uniref:Mitochondrial transcription termination factor family protein n=1 Tax=Actinidia rufa TaxID=165716 RepID=A0A7J0DIY3_9ERIC|nr:mitochondrial transcription termination factor family protein [Actinidia rufa]
MWLVRYGVSGFLGKVWGSSIRRTGGVVWTVEGNVDAWIEVCREIRVFYDLGCEKGLMEELMGRRKTVLLQYPQEVLAKKAGFFSRLGVSTSDVGLLLLEKPEILGFDLEDRVISVLGLLKHFGMNRKELRSVAVEYLYVLGRNKMVNLPHVMRAMDLHEWFFTKMKVANHRRFREIVEVSFPSDSSRKDIESICNVLYDSATSRSFWILIGSAGTGVESGVILIDPF